MKRYDLTPSQMKKLDAIRLFWYDFSQVNDLEQKLERARKRLYTSQQALYEANINIREVEEASKSSKSKDNFILRKILRE